MKVIKHIIGACTCMLFLMGMSEPVSSQNPDDLDCFQQWEQVFLDRGAYDVEDGEYNDVIVTIRSKVKRSEDDYIMETVTKCYSGKATVLEGKVSEIFIKVVDNSYEKLDRKFKYFNQDATIENGMTRNIVTKEGELINVIFSGKLKPKSPDKAISKAESAQ
ncbi:MAG: hypothetical protein KDD36_00010 [Flavobacteriales bacterium]|nr:hypothetical protein [Flavobacteriales bacterium]